MITEDTKGLFTNGVICNLHAVQRITVGKCGQIALTPRFLTPNSPAIPSTLKEDCIRVCLANRGQTMPFCCCSLFKDMMCLDHHTPLQVLPLSSTVPATRVAIPHHLCCMSLFHHRQSDSFFVSKTFLVVRLTTCNGMCVRSPDPPDGDGATPASAGGPVSGSLSLSLSSSYAT